jgi:hypothetical protein
MKPCLYSRLSTLARCAPPIALAAGLLAGCSMPRMDIWPFNGSSDTGNVPPPPNASHYQCNSGASFWLRKLADGNMWVIYPDRQIRLDKQDNGSFSNGIAVLQFEGETATLRDGPQINYANCTIAAAKK